MSADRSHRAVSTDDTEIVATVRARLRGVIDQASRSVAEGRPADGVEAFLALIANGQEAEALSGDTDALEEFAPYLPIDIEEFRDALAFDGPSPTDPAALARITAPTLVLHGSDTALGMFTDGARDAADHIPGATLRQIEGVGHLGHLVHPDRAAALLAPFLEKHHGALTGHGAERIR